MSATDSISLLLEREKALQNLEALLVVRDREVFELKTRLRSTHVRSEIGVVEVVSLLESANRELQDENVYLKRELREASRRIEDQSIALAAYERSVEEKLALIREMEDTLVKRWDIIQEYDKALAEAREALASLGGD